MEKAKNRRATFVCSLSFKNVKGKIVTAEGRLEGNIANRILGKNGFGYDPIFKPLNKKYTFGQMAKIKKINMDHRFLAFKKLKKKAKI